MPNVAACARTTMSLFQKARSSTATSETAMETDPQSYSGELSAELDKLIDSDDLGSNLEADNRSEDDGCDECVTSDAIVSRRMVALPLLCSLHFRWLYHGSGPGILVR